MQQADHAFGLIRLLGFQFLCAHLLIVEVGVTWAEQLRVYLGTYTDGNSLGIYTSLFDTDVGRLQPVELAIELVNPSFLATHPALPVLYAVGEVGMFEGNRGGRVFALKVNERTGQLNTINHQTTHGVGPCHLAVDPQGKGVVVANYGGGSVVSYPLGEDGSLKQTASLIQFTGSSVNRQRQEAPHTHCVRFDPSGLWAAAADLGLDQVILCRFTPQTAELSRVGNPGLVPPGSGPRHLCFHPHLPRMYVINELANTISVFKWSGDQGLELLQTVGTLPADFMGTSYTAEVVIHPSGAWLYGSNRGHDSIATFRVHPAHGTLEFVGVTSTQGKTPRNFNLDPSGRWLLVANQQSDQLVVFAVDKETGLPRSYGSPVPVPRPVCVTFWSANIIQ